MTALETARLTVTNPRGLALAWLKLVVLDGQSINQILPNKPKDLSGKDQALAKQLLFGSLRFFHQLELISKHLMDKPIKNKDKDILLIIVMGLYQLKYLSIPDHAALSESVKLTKKQGKQWASGLVNAVLRRYQREKVTIEKSMAESSIFNYSHPDWIIEQLYQDWPNDAKAILLGNNQQAPMILRANTLRNSRETYLEKLNQEKLLAKPHPLAVDGILLDKAVDVNQLPGFKTGDVTVQDAAAQLVIELLDLKAGQRVLDACAAPGGKTTHILQRQQNLRLSVVDVSEKRMQKVQQTLERMQFSQVAKTDLELKMGDLNDTDSWWNGEKFDRILLDAPCSATGVIRRNPDIKVHRRSSDINALVELQASLLITAWKLLKPGGVLVYATCSVFRAENENQIKQFLKENSIYGKNKAEIIGFPKELDAKIYPGKEPAEKAEFSERTELGYQIFPGEYDMDGFYFCGIRKTH
jgi:16S rRNA (cytosine967-C5)-methyltransferase